MKETTFDNVKLIHGDCMEYLCSLPDNAFDLAVVDPPYNLPKDSCNGRGKLKDRAFNRGNIKTWDISPTREYFYELFRVSRNQIIWGGNYFPLPPARGIICWDKCQPWTNFSQWEMAWTSFVRPAALFRYDNRTGGKIHPCQKPVALYAWILNNFAKVGNKILDTHLGSASSAIAAYELGFEFVGIEIDEYYYNKAVERLRRHTMQQDMFHEEYKQLNLFEE